MFVSVKFIDAFVFCIVMPVVFRFPKVLWLALTAPVTVRTPTTFTLSKFVWPSTSMSLTNVELPVTSIPLEKSTFVANVNWPAD